MAALRKHAPALLGAALTIAALAGAVPAAAGSERETSRIVVTTTDATAAAHVGAELREHGARDLRQLKVVNGFSAEVPASYVSELRREPGVRSVTVDGTVKLLTAEPGLDPSNFGSLSGIARVVNANDAWNAGVTGKGVDVALIDSGVVPVQGLTSGNVVNGPDLSFESQSDALRSLDTFGHGTHMASIIAGRDAVASGGTYANDTTSFKGVAPDARVVSIKVADHSGATDVSQVIAAIDWVVENSRSHGLNMRVLNLSFGTDSTQWYAIDPLCFAVENAWRNGIAVVVAGGNDGTSKERLANPAQDPFVIAVGSSDSRGTKVVQDDAVASFSSRGSATRHVDLVAPGVSVHGLRAPGSHIDQTYAAARSGTRFFKGSGTSQSAAVVSGAAALLLQKYPHLTPDQVKSHLMGTATAFSSAPVRERGSGVINVRKAVATTPAPATQAHSAGTGTGSLEAARGSYHVGSADNPLTGERDIFGNAFDSAKWATATTTGTAWDGGSWLGTVWTGNGFTANDWTGAGWAGAGWAGAGWAGAGWADSSWEGHAWTGAGWAGAGWANSAWSGAGWAGAGWAGAGWAGAGWATGLWSSSAWE